MTIEANDIIDWEAMSAPPNFHSTVREQEKESEKTKKETKPFLVVTVADDFLAIASAWPTASTEARAAAFWQLGLLHVCEAEVMRLPEEARAEALAMDGVTGPAGDDPAVVAKSIAQALREVRQRHGIEPRQQRADDNTVYRQLLALRASGPYCGPDDVRVVHLRQGMV